MERGDGAEGRGRGVRSVATRALPSPSREGTKASAIMRSAWRLQRSLSGLEPGLRRAIDRKIREAIRRSSLGRQSGLEPGVCGAIGGRRPVDRKSGALIGRSSAGHQKAVRRPSGGHKEAIGRRSGGHPGGSVTSRMVAQSPAVQSSASRCNQVHSRCNHLQDGRPETGGYVVDGGIGHNDRRDGVVAPKRGDHAAPLGLRRA